MAINDNLISYYKLEGNSNDSIGTYNGTDTSMSYGISYGKIGQGGNFDGSNSVIKMATFARPTTAITASAWVKTSTKGKCFYGMDDSVVGNQQRSMQFQTDGTTGVPRFIIFNASTNNNVAGTTNVCDGNWHFVVGTYNGTAIYVYVDGKQEGSDTALTGNIRSGTVS